MLDWVTGLCPGKTDYLFEDEQPCLKGLPELLAQLVGEAAESEAFAKKFGTSLVLTPGQRKLPAHSADGPGQSQ